MDHFAKEESISPSSCRQKVLFRNL